MEEHYEDFNQHNLTHLMAFLRADGTKICVYPDNKTLFYFLNIANDSSRAYLADVSHSGNLNIIQYTFQ